MKLLTILLSVLVAMLLVVGCTKTEGDATAEPVVEVPEQPAAPAEEPAVEEPVACTMDAKVCPDGSSVGRVAPDCEFAACPEVEEPVVQAQEPTPAPVVSQNQIHLIEILNNTFSPETLTIKVGDTVTWKNTRSGFNGRAMIIGSRQCRDVKSNMFGPGETFSWTFNRTDECTITDGFIVGTEAGIITIVE